MNRLPRSQLFMLELIAAVLIFALCMAVCAGLFIKAGSLSTDSRNLTGAVYAVETAAEAFAAEPSLTALARTLEGTVDGGTVTVYYDKQWKSCGAADARFTLTARETQEGSLKCLSLSMTTLSGKAVYFADMGVYAGDGGELSE